MGKKDLNWGEWSSVLRFAIRIIRFLVQIPLGALSTLGAQPHYEAHGDLRVEIVQTQ